MAALVYSFGFVSMLVCFALVLATIMFSSEPGDEESIRFAAAQAAGEPTTFMGGL